MDSDEVGELLLYQHGKSQRQRWLLFWTMLILY
jgi:hypothetical protein